MPVFKINLKLQFLDGLAYGLLRGKMMVTFFFLKYGTFFRMYSYSIHY